MMPTSGHQENPDHTTRGCGSEFLKTAPRKFQVFVLRNVVLFLMRHAEMRNGRYYLRRRMFRQLMGNSLDLKTGEAAEMLRMLQDRRFGLRSERHGIFIKSPVNADGESENENNGGHDNARRTATTIG